MANPIIGLKNLSMQRALRFALIGQGLLAVLLLLADVGGHTADRLFHEQELTTGPVSPGDQRRHYNPSRRPTEYLGPTEAPSIDLPSDLPERLEFSLQTADGIGEVLVINGPIEPGDADRFTGYFGSLDARPDGVAINSPGGAVAEALSIGRKLREEGMRTVILPGTICLSACPYILAGGTEREVSLRGAVGLHQHYFDAPGYLPVFLAVEDIQHGQGRTMDFLIEMGIDPGLMLYSLNTPPDDIYLLVEEELVSTRLASEVVD